MKTSEAKGQVLSYLVAKCIYEPDDVVICRVGQVFAYDDAIKGFNPPTNWAQGGLIIEREKIALNLSENGWVATRIEPPSVSEARGPTPLVAAMRCYVASKLGDEVEVPDELVEKEV
jgi:hypothetical protein